MKTTPILCLLLSLSSGCAWLDKAEPHAADILNIVTDAAQLIAVLHSLSAAHFAEHPDPKAQADVERAFAATHQVLDAAQRAKDVLGSEQFADFKRSYADLQATLKKAGVALPVGMPRPLAE